MRILFYKNLIFTALIALLVFAFPSTTVAQIEFKPSTDTISLRQSPLFPDPGETVEVSVVSQVINLNDRQITWEQDGQVVASGTGETEVSITAGDSGETTVIYFRVVVDGEIVEREIEIQPVDVQLIWEAQQSYTPHFYEGKALHPGWGPLQVTALPDISHEDGGSYNPQQLLYKWTYNGLVHGSDSGRGAQSFVVNSVPRRGNTVTVEIETPSGDRVAKESITIPISQPEVLLYNHSPLLGTLYKDALAGDYMLDSATEEVEITAIPYFFLASRSTAPQLTFDWEMNGSTLSPNDRKNMVRFRRQEGVEGEARVDVEVDDSSRIFSGKSATVNLRF